MRQYIWQDILFTAMYGQFPAVKRYVSAIYGIIVLLFGAISWNLLELHNRKVNAYAIYWQISVLRLSTTILDSFFRDFFKCFDLNFCFLLQGIFQMFRLKFLLPSSGIFSNFNFLNFFKNAYLKFFLKKEAKILVETFEKIPEEGNKKFSRNIWKNPWRRNQRL